MSKKLALLVAALLLIVAGVWWLREGSGGTAFVWQLTNGGKWLLPLIGISAAIDSINPCAFSILLVTVAFLFSMGALRSRILSIGGTYISGIFVAYLAIGLGILQTLHLFNTPHFMAKVGAAALMIFGGINLLNEFFPAFPIKLRIPHSVHRTIAVLTEKGSLPTAFALGGLVGLCEFPCTGGPYLLVLGLLHDQATYLKGFAYLLFYNAVFVLPLVLILFAASEHRLLTKIQEWRKKETGKMRLWSSVAMILLGLLIFWL